MAKTRSSKPSRGATGGAAGEPGSVHRASVTTLIATIGLNGRPVTALRMMSGPDVIVLETDFAVDDIVVIGQDGQRVFIQAKASLDMGEVMAKVAQQRATAVKKGEVAGDDVLAAVGSKVAANCAHASGNIGTSSAWHVDVRQAREGA